VLRSHRLRAKLTQQELAERMETSHSAISRIESGRHKTSAPTFQRLADAFFEDAKGQVTDFDRREGFDEKRRIERAMESERLAASDRTLVPNRYTVHLNPDDVAAFGSSRNQFWVKTVVAWLVASVVMVTLSIQLVSPTRRWRPGRPRRGPQATP
jgi:transcriptional regulator with XRE-family HTH domain